MKSASLVVAEERNGRTILADLRSEPPLSLRPTRCGVAMVGSAAGPVGGDEVSLRVDVGSGASLHMEAIAATMVFPGRGGSASHQSISIRVEEGGHLRWCGQPLLSVVRSTHTQNVTIELAPTATLDWVDSVVLGRSGEPPGVLDTMFRVVRAGSVVLHQRQLYDPESPSWSTTAGLGGFHEVRQRVLIGPAAQPASVDSAPGHIEMTTPISHDISLNVGVSKHTSIA